jgi:hypothetical protein
MGVVGILSRSMQVCSHQLLELLIDSRETGCMGGKMEDLGYPD